MHQPFTVIAIVVGLILGTAYGTHHGHQLRATPKHDYQNEYDANGEAEAMCQGCYKLTNSGIQSYLSYAQWEYDQPSWNQFKADYALQQQQVGAVTNKTKSYNQYACWALYIRSYLLSDPVTGFIWSETIKNQATCIKYAQGPENYTSVCGNSVCDQTVPLIDACVKNNVLAQQNCSDVFEQALAQESSAQEINATRTLLDSQKKLVQQWFHTQNDEYFKTHHLKAYLESERILHTPNTRTYWKCMLQEYKNCFQNLDYANFSATVHTNLAHTLILISLILFLHLFE